MPYLPESVEWSTGMKYSQILECIQKLLLYIATAMYDERDALHMTVTHVYTYLHLIVIG